jgi:hypothetical protein
MRRGYAHEISFVAALVVTNGRYNTGLCYDVVEIVTTLGKGVNKCLTESDETGPIETLGTKNDRLELVADCIEAAESPAVEFLVETDYDVS